MLEKLNKDMIDAMKSGEKEKLTVIRGVKAEIKKQEIDKKIEATDELLIEVVSHQIKLLKDSIVEFEKGSRDDLVEKANFEINVLQEYLPEALSEEEVDKIIEGAVATLNATSMKDMGNVMKEVKPKVAGRFDMKEVSNKIKNKLS